RAAEESFRPGNRISYGALFQHLYVPPRPECSRPHERLSPTARHAVRVTESFPPCGGRRGGRPSDPRVEQRDDLPCRHAAETRAFHSAAGGEVTLGAVPWCRSALRGLVATMRTMESTAFSRVDWQEHLAQALR